MSLVPSFVSFSEFESEALCLDVSPDPQSFPRSFHCFCKLMRYLQHHIMQRATIAQKKEASRQGSCKDWWQDVGFASEPHWSRSSGPGPACLSRRKCRRFQCIYLLVSRLHFSGSADQPPTLYFLSCISIPHLLRVLSSFVLSIDELQISSRTCEKE
ncbi:hypothetical protein K402DRAFT_14750 [Aulographum hederae CBS 113979]|uniref:Uncharacterized protein n=1 Tax=Aulographum hederae CBS 113979 TaxID=1176131 RepID=A0A6G1H7D3_9PEZI|nr:hypothetical protein K402DRAFT_14750 [Aulographum hederae CBS 113979]